MKQEFKSSLFIIIKNIIYGLVGGAFAGFIASYFLDLNIAIAIGGVLGLAVIYFAVIGDNIKVVIEGDEVSVYKLGKVKHQFNLKKVHLSARIKTTYDSAGSDSDCNLYVTDEDGNTKSIDCSMLGASRFYKLVDALGITDGEPTKVETKKKEKVKE